MANVAVTNTTGLYGTTSKTPVLNSAQQLLTLLDNNGNVNFALDPATGNTTVYSYFTGNAGGGSGGNLALYGSVQATGPLGTPIFTVLTPTGVTSGTYGNATTIPVITVGTDGRVANITTITTAAASYSNANVASYLPVYNGNITAAYVNIAQLLTSQTANVTGNVNAGNVVATGYFVGDGSKLTNIPTGSSSYGNANVAAYMPTYLPTYGGTLAPSIIATNNYLWANNVPINFGGSGSYGNSNVAAYLPTNSTIIAINANVAGANAAQIAANTIQSNQINALTSGLTAANAAIVSVQGNLTAFETYANATFSTGSYGNANVAAYLPTYTGTVQVGNITTTSGTHNIGTPAAPFDTINVGNIAGASGSVVRVDSSGSQPGLYVETTGITSFQRDFVVETVGLVNAVTLSQTGQVTATASIQAGTNVFAGGQVIAQGNITANATAGAYFIGDGSKLINLPVQSGTYSNSNVASYLPTYSGSLNNSSSIISLQGNIAAANAAIASTNANLSSFETYANANFITSGTSYSNANVAAYLVTNTGNIQTGNITPYINGLLNIGSTSKSYSNGYIANLYNVNSINDSTGATRIGVSLSPLTNGLSVGSSSTTSYGNPIYVEPSGGGTVQVALGTDGTITAQGNITANAAAGAYFIGDGSKLINLPVTPTTYSNANVAAYLPTYTGTLGGTLTTTPQPLLSNLGGAEATTIIGYNAWVDASANQTTIGSKNNIYLNAAISSDGTTVGSQAVLNTSGQFVTTALVTGNISSTNGFFWSNGTAYSTGSGTTFTGNLAGYTLVDTVNERILVNASPASSLPTTSQSNQVSAVYVQPTYTTGVLQAPATAQTVIMAMSANINLQSSYASSGNRNTYGTENYLSIYPTTANTMTNSDRVRSNQIHLDIFPSGKTWGTMSSASQASTPLSAIGAQSVFIGNGNVSSISGMTTASQIVTGGGGNNANIQYQNGLYASMGWTTVASGTTASSIQYARLISGNIAISTQANVIIANAVGIHTANGWSGAGASVTNRYAVLNEDPNTTIQSAGNVVLAGTAGIKFNDGTFQTTAATGGGSTYSNSNVASYLPTSTVTFGGNIATVSGNANIVAASNLVDMSTNTGGLQLPFGGNAARPSTPKSGTIRFNSDRANPEWYDGNDNLWKLFSETYSPTYTASYLLVAGGGGGGSDGGNPSYLGGGGGAGGLLTGTQTLNIGTTYSFTVGAGGSTATTGSNTTGFSLTALGGGAGGQYPTTSGGSGGSGGGAAANSSGYSGGSGTAGQGNAGGNSTGQASAYGGGGGGGAGAAGAAATANYGGNGGDGVQSSITGSAVYYAGGGGGGAYSGGLGAGSGGQGGGGNAALWSNITANATAGTANSGGGGGGAYQGSAANGGSGVVILSVPTVFYSGVTTGSPTVTTSGSNTILTFTASGSYTA